MTTWVEQGQYSPQAKSIDAEFESLEARANEQLEANSEAFVKELSKLLRKHPYEFAVYSDRKFAGAFPSLADAVKYATQTFGRCEYSVHHVSEEKTLPANRILAVSLSDET